MVFLNALALALALAPSDAAVAQTAGAPAPSDIPRDSARRRARQPPELDTVRVSVASRTAATGAAAARSVEVVDRSMIERTAARTLADLLALTVGADVLWRSPAQADLALRGGSYEQVLVLVDGVRVKDVQSGHFSLDLAVPLDQVERVEVLRGTGSALFGPDAVGGVVNVVTRRDVGWRTARLRAGTFGTTDGAVAGGAALGGFTVNAALDHSRSSGHREGTDYRATQARVVARRVGRLGTLQSDAGVGARAFGAADFYAPFPSYETTRTTTLGTRWDAPGRGVWRVSTALATRRHTDDYILKRADPAFYRNEHLGWQTTGEVMVRRSRATAPLQLAMGAEGVDARLASARLGDRRELRRAGFAEATYGRPGRATVNGGFRYEHATSYGTFASPTLAAALPIGRTLWLRGSAARGFRAPTWTERYYRDPGNIGSPGLRPETFWSEELGVRAAPGWAPRGARLDVVGFARQARNLIDWARPADAPRTEPWRTQNVERARIRGVEARLDLPDLLGASWVVRASGLTLDAGSAANVVGKYALRPLTRTMGASVALPAARSWPRVAIDATHARRLGEPGRLVVNTRMSGVWHGTQFTLDAMNLGDASWIDVAGRQAPGRAVYAGVGWSRGAR